MEVSREYDEWDVDGGQVMGEPARQVDVGDRAIVGPEALGNLGKRASESVGRKDHGFAGDNAGRDCGSAVGSPHEARPEDVRRAGFDREPDESVDQLDGGERSLTMTARLGAYLDQKSVTGARAPQALLTAQRRFGSVQSHTRPMIEAALDRDSCVASGIRNGCRDRFGRAHAEVEPLEKF